MVGSRARDDREGAAGGAADLGVEPVRDDAELADRVLREARPREAESLVGEVDAVHHDRRLACVAAGPDHGSAADEAIAAALALHAGGDERELLEVAVGDRERLDLLGEDVGRRVGLDDVHQRRLRGHRDLLGLCLLHRCVDPKRLADAEGEVLLDHRDETLELEAEGVGAGRKRRETRAAVGLGDYHPRKPCGRVRQFGGHTR